MRIALIADIHGNLPALEAILRDIRKKHSPDRIISLGDQVNLGPNPREVLALARAENIECLHGNHERYILSVMEGRPGYEGANFDSLRFNARLLLPEEITFPKTLQIGHVLFTHAMPDDDRFPVYEVDQAIPKLLEMSFDQPTHIICGHGHNPTHIRVPNLTLDSIGSAGCMDDGIPGAAPYAILTIDKGCSGIRPYHAAYDPRWIKPLFVQSGMADFCPTMARISCLQATENICILVDFVIRAQALSRARGESCISPETWADADAAFPWPDGLTTAQFWAR